MWCQSIDVPDIVSLAVHYSRDRGLTWLDSASPNHRFGQYSYLCIDPVKTLDGTGDLGTLRSALGRCKSSRIKDGPPFQGGLAGYFDYEFGSRLIDGMDPPAKYYDQDHCFALYDTLIAVDHLTGRCWILSAGMSAVDFTPNKAVAQRRIQSIAREIADISPFTPTTIDLDWTADITKSAHTKNIQQTKDYIAAGDIYQANIAQTFWAELKPHHNPLSLYLNIRASNPAPFSAFSSSGKRAIACTSPERLFCLSADGIAEARPIKGTIKRSHDPHLDQKLRHQLQTSKKDRAENIMIVDLLRNDLSRVCAPHSVGVPELCQLETYAGLHQLTSSVEGKLEPGKDAFDVFAAVFPGGSITGAPKARAMEIIEEIEHHPRGAFCGAFGYFGFDGTADMNIMIRTVQIKENTARLDVGGGITHLSDPDAEYHESLLKADRIMAGTTQMAAV